MRYSRSMAEDKRLIDRLLDPSYLAGLPERTTDEIRAMRAECSKEEASFSYERRLLHGRLAILHRELERREGKETSSIIADLPNILADDSHPRGRGSFASQDPTMDFDKPSRRVTKLLADDTLANLGALSVDEIGTRVETLAEVEQECSVTRRSILDVLDALNLELARRYRTGEADPSDVLSGR